MPSSNILYNVNDLSSDLSIQCLKDEDGFEQGAQFLSLSGAECLHKSSVSIKI